MNQEQTRQRLIELGITADKMPENGICDLRGANLHWVNLREANLSEADLRGANLDYSCWPLWCGTLNIKKASLRLAVQLLAHAVCVLCAARDDGRDVSEMIKTLCEFCLEVGVREEIAQRLNEIINEVTTKTE